jgi:hypothetical protein
MLHFILANNGNRKNVVQIYKHMLTFWKDLETDSYSYRI